MPECIDCDAPIRKGARCQTCRLEHLYGSVSDWDEEGRE